MGLQGQKKLLMSSFTLQMDWDQLTHTMEEGSAGEDSIHWERGVWINGEGDCPKAAGPSHLLRVRERERDCGGGLDKHSPKKVMALQQ